MTAFLDDKEFGELKTENNSQKFYSRFNFLNNHFGFRCGEVHNFIAPQGGSKSTMTRSLVTELIGQFKKTYLQLSEETWKSYIYSINALLRKAEPEKFQSMLECLHGFSEMETDENLTEFKNNYFKKMYEQILENNYEILFIDNWTTSFLGMDSISNQDRNAKLLKRLAIACNIPIIVLCHSSKNTDAEKQVIRSEDVRGSASTVNIGSYNYIIQTMYNQNPPKTFLLVDKARHHSKANKKIYELKFNSEFGVFSTDKLTTKEDLRKCLKIKL